MKKTVHVISHVHWDREWYRTFESYRYRLVKMVDQTLNLLQAGEYETFLLDGQTSVLEDYFEINPETKPNIAGLIKRGKLIIGPWYILPDEFLVSGESIIRNLMLGIKMAKSFGKENMLGYLPDMFGHIAQMPQILSGFKIDKAVVWRGVNPKKDFFKWVGLDDTGITAFYLSEGYYNTFILEDELNLNGLKEHLEKLDQFSGENILFPSGGDHLAPTENLKDKLTEINSKQKEYQFIQSTYDKFFNSVKINHNELEKIKGELRNSDRAYILPGVFSSRTNLKQRNHYLENLLTKTIEPLCSLSWILGNNYHKNFIDKAWKLLLQNQPHDSICGCSIDEVHEEMLQRYNSAEQICNEIALDILEKVSNSIELDHQEEYIIFYNTSNWQYSNIYEVEIDFDISEEINSFKLIDENNNEVPHYIIESKVTRKFVLDLEELEHWKEIKRFKTLVKIDNIEPYFYKALKITKTNKIEALKSIEDNLNPSNKIENKFISLEVENKNLVLINKKSKEKYFINNFSVSSDAGDEYNYSPPKQDYFAESNIIKTELIENNNLRRTIKVEYEILIPESLSKNRESSSEKLIKTKIYSELSLKKEDPNLYIKTELNNESKDYRLRVNFQKEKYSKESKCFYDTQFGTLEKEFKTNKQELVVGKLKERIEETFAIQSFAGITEKETAFFILSKGIPECEITKFKDKEALSLTLLRNVGWLSRDDLRTRGGGAGPMFKTPEAQCLGKHKFEYAIYTESNKKPEININKIAHQYLTKDSSIQIKPKNCTKFPLNSSLIKIHHQNVVVTCLKKSEDSNGIIFRFYNPSSEKINYELITDNFFEYNKIYEVGLDESNIKSIKIDDSNTIFGVLEPYKIKTLKFVLIE